MLASILLRKSVMDASHLRLDASLRTEIPAAAPLAAPAAAPVAPPQPTWAPAADMERPGFQSALNEPSSELEFSDFLDVINPLQHIPIIGSIYRAVTGDEISGPARIVGGALFGGPIGFVSGIINAIAAEASGNDLGELAVAALFGGEDTDVAVVQNSGDSGDAIEAPPLALAAIQSTPLPVAAASEASGKPPLTGAAALRALTADLRGANAVQATLAQATPAAPGNPSAAPRVGVATAQLRPLALPSLDEFTLQMLDGLDKYKALATARQQPDEPQ